MAVSSTIRLRFDGASVKKGLAEIKKAFANIAQSGLSAFKGMLSPVAKIAALLGPTAIAGGFAKILKDSSEAAANFENMKSQFELFTGSVQESKELIDDLRKIAIRSPLELSDISDGARSLLTYGVAAKEVAGITDQLSEVAAGNAERFGRLSYAFGQISSLGRLMGTELRQLTEAGFNPLESIAKRTGRTMMQLKKDMEDGKISIEMVKGALKDATSEGGRFYGLNDKMSQTFSGRVSMMRDQWGRLLVDLGSGLNSGLKVAVDSLTSQMPVLSEKFKILGGIIGPAIADAVAGDFERFVKIGDFIGEAIKVGLSAAWQSIGTELVKGFLKTGSGDTAIDRWMNSKIDSMGGSPGEILSANVQNSRLGSMADGLRGSARVGSDTPGYRMANPGERSAFTDETGRRLVSALEGVVAGSGGRFRYANERDGPSSFTDAVGNKVVEILTSINRNVAPQL